MSCSNFSRESRNKFLRIGWNSRSECFLHHVFCRNHKLSFRAATAIVGSSQSPETKSGYSQTHEVAIPVFFGFIYSQCVVTESSDYSSVWTLQLCILQFLNPSPRPPWLPELCSAGARNTDRKSGSNNLVVPRFRTRLTKSPSRNRNSWELLWSFSRKRLCLLQTVVEPACRPRWQGYLLAFHSNSLKQCAFPIIFHRTFPSERSLTLKIFGHSKILYFVEYFISPSAFGMQSVVT